MSESKENIVKLYIDDREDNRRINRVIEKNPEYNPQIKHLRYGDYHYITNTGTRVIWEYKTGSDFLSSIQDNHLHNQVYNMKKHYDLTFLMIQVSDWEYLLQSYKRVTGIDISLKRVAGQIALFNGHTTVIQCKNMSYALYMMKRQSEKIIEDKPLLYKFNKKSPNYAENRLNCIYGVSSELAEQITNTLNLKSEKDLMNLTINDLRIVEGIGYKKAENILQSLHGA
jgi:ERCC4-type nuclease